MNKKQQSKELTSLKETYRAHLNSLTEIEDKACKLLNIDPDNSDDYDSDWVLDYLNGQCSQSVLRKNIKQ